MDLSASSTAVAPSSAMRAQKWCRWGISAPVGGAAVLRDRERRGSTRAGRQAGGDRARSENGHS